MLVRMVRIARLDGRRTEVPLEAPGGGSGETELLFDRAALLIQTEWKQRRSERELHRGPRSKRDMRWLKVTCYSLVSEMLRLDQADVFDSRIKQHGRYPRGPRGAPNPFQTGLMALFANDPSALDARDRERIGKLLWYAFRHYVPVEFLIGFLVQREVKGQTTRFTGWELDPEFTDWIVERRLLERDDADRGVYPKHIEDAVEARQMRLRVASDEYDSDWDEDD